MAHSIAEQISDQILTMSRIAENEPPTKKQRGEGFEVEGGEPFSRKNPSGETKQSRKLY